MSGPDLGFSPVFVIGAPRSGTTWLQNMLGSHPAVCAPQETGLFHTYLAGWQEAWEREMEEAARPRARRRGLPSVLTAEQFRLLLRDTAVRVYRAALDTKPSAVVLLDKEPTNTRHTFLIAATFPEARFVHLLRDGRDVSVSMLAAGEGWARDWAPSRVRDAARAWQDHVLEARRRAGSDRPYLEVRYEDLLERPGPVLGRLFHFIGVPVEAAAVDAIAGQFSFERVRAGESGLAWGGELSHGGPAAEPVGFYRKGTAGGWRDEWSPVEQAEFDRVAGQLLVDTGYEASRDWYRPGGAARAARIRGALDDALRSRAKGLIRSWIARHPSLQSG